MLDAYANIKNTSYRYGVFIAGPSKTAEIEQSLVIGTHGTRSLTIFILAEPA
jgi:L-lactate dehydrogenase complex protein LldG